MGGSRSTVEEQTNERSVERCLPSWEQDLNYTQLTLHRDQTNSGFLQEAALFSESGASTVGKTD